MRKTATIMVFILVLPGTVLANPVYEERGNQASNTLYKRAGGDCDDTDA
ncbi:MAG: hypothetical protein ABEJ99_04505 [Candidatus Nanohaloarchaea archaeon]